MIGASGFAIGVDRSHEAFRGFLPRKTTPRELYGAAVIANRSNVEGSIGVRGCRAHAKGLCVTSENGAPSLPEAGYDAGCNLTYARRGRELCWCFSSYAEEQLPRVFRYFRQIRR